MSMRKLKPILIMVGAVVGGFLLLAAGIRAYKQSQADTSGQTTFWSAFMAQLQGMSAMQVLVGLATMVQLISMQLLPVSDGVTFAMLIGTVASGVGVSTQIPTITTVHQFLWFEIATTPQSLKVNVNGDTLICDLDTAGLNVMKNQRSNGPFTNGFLIQLATGMIVNRNVDITVVNNVASAFSVFGFNRRRDLMGNERYIQSLGINLNASQGFDVTNFVYFGAPSLASSDILNVYSNGRKTLRTDSLSTKQELESTRGILQLYENQASALKSAAFDNWDQDIDKISIIPVAAQKIYISRVIAAGSKVSSSLLH